MAQQQHQSPDPQIPTATLALPSIPSATPTAAARRGLPPPCWSPDETVALIDAYKEKWYSLRRGNLRANHWQDVADDVASRCPVNPPKTAVQCRHKMEKLRKRYRAEIQRSAGVKRFNSSWAHFQNMHSMEKGPNATNNPTPPSSSSDEEIDDHHHKKINQKGIFGNQLDNNKNNGLGLGLTTPGVRIKIPGRVPSGSGPSPARVYTNLNQMGVQTTHKAQNPYNPNPNPRFNNYVASGGYGVGVGSSKVSRDGFSSRGEMGKRVGEISKEKEGGDDGVGEVVEAIQALGEGFMRIEKAKMDMAREIEEMRMDMELKRTEMILESQHRIVEAFAEAISERRSSVSNKKAKRTPNNE